MSLEIKKFNSEIRQKLHNYIRINNNGIIKKGSVTKTVEEAIEFFLDNPDQVEIFRKKKKESLKKILKANLYLLLIAFFALDLP